MDLLSFDPGMKGAWAFFKDGILTDVGNIPVADDAIDSRKLRYLICDAGHSIEVAIEDLHHIEKRQKQRGIDTQYINYGRIISQIETCSNVIVVHYVVPTSWQTTAGITKNLSYDQRKHESIEIWSDQRALFLKGNSKVTYDDNRAEAAHIGRHILISKKDKKWKKK